MVSSMWGFSKSQKVVHCAVVFLCVSMGLSNQGHANSGRHLGWCNINNPHYDTVACGGLGGTPAGVNSGTTNPTGSVSGTSGAQPVVNAQPLVLTPLPPMETISGHGVVQAITTSSGPDITGFSPGYVIHPLPPQTFAGVSPGAIQSTPGPSFSGYSPAINVNPVIAPSFTGFSPVTIIHPIAAPSFSGTSPVVTIIPIATPSFSGFSPVITVHPITAPSFSGIGSQRPQQTVPSVNATIAPVLVPRPRPTPNRPNRGTSLTNINATHSPNNGGSQNRDIITPTAGRQSVQNVPSVTSQAGEQVRCLTSGHGVRRDNTTTGRNPSALRNANRIDSLARDIPARHPDVAHCLISIRTSSR